MSVPAAVIEAIENYTPESGKILLPPSRKEMYFIFDWDVRVPSTDNHDQVGKCSVLQFELAVRRRLPTLCPLERHPRTRTARKVWRNGISQNPVEIRSSVPNPPDSPTRRTTCPFTLTHPCDYSQYQIPTGSWPNRDGGGRYYQVADHRPRWEILDRLVLYLVPDG